MDTYPPIRMEFHISRQARDLYQFDQSLFALSGNVIFVNFFASRTFAQKMNHKRDLIRFPEQAVRAGQLNAMGLIDEILHYVIGLYRLQVNPSVMSGAMVWLNEQLGEGAIEATLISFADQFPPLAVYQGDTDLPEYMEGDTEGIPNRQILLEEMLLACPPCRKLLLPTRWAWFVLLFLL